LPFSEQPILILMQNFTH